MARPGSTLLLAEVGDRRVGFAVTALEDSVLEVVYLAVDPDAWGLGVASGLLARVDQACSAAGVEGRLWVIEDNLRAKRLYEHVGWRAMRRLEVRHPGGRTERLMVRR